MTDDLHAARQPEPNTRGPLQPFPLHACDTLFHVFPKAIQFSGEPGHFYEPPHAPMSAAMQMHRRLGVDRGVIAHATIHGKDTSVLFDALEEGEGRYRGLLTADSTPLLEREVIRCHEVGVRGIRIAFMTYLGGPPSLSQLDWLDAQASEAGWHLVLHISASDLVTHEAVVRNLRSSFIVDHMAKINPKEGLDQPALQLLTELMRSGQAWARLSNGDRLSEQSLGFTDVVPLARQIIAAAPRRVLWATDWPHLRYAKPRMVNDGELGDLFNTCCPEESLREQILVTNPHILYDFEHS